MENEITKEHSPNTGECVSDLSTKLCDLKSTLTRDDTTAEVLGLSCYKLVETLEKVTEKVAVASRSNTDSIHSQSRKETLQNVQHLQQVLHDIAEQLTAQLFVINRQMPTFRHIVLSQLTYWSTMLLKCIGSELGDSEEIDYGQTCIALATLLTTIISHVTAFATANYQEEENEDEISCTNDGEVAPQSLAKEMDIDSDNAEEIPNRTTEGTEQREETAALNGEIAGDESASNVLKTGGVQKFTIYKTKYDASRNLTMHAKTHNLNVFECTICKKTFDAKPQLLLHAKDIHKKKNLFECHDCTKAFTTRQSLKVHTRTHTGEKPYICEYCAKAFSVLSNLRQHIRLHTNEKPYKCSDCDLSFRVKRNLSKHQQKHTDS
ncbi:Zinc finger protein 157 [Trichoplax sp. H2]|nr:Zinc finger protein 157 [Trichoplax sp. H2]|eukprot:RDD37277.1 Zinc finger protein 157 [Trichoplax sp. H2]